MTWFLPRRRGCREESSRGSWFSSWLDTRPDVGCVFVFYLPAIAAPKDAAANKLADDAINSDYLATNFAEAEKKLRKAVALCGADACTSAKCAHACSATSGSCSSQGSSGAEDGRAAFVEALKADPSIGLEKDLTTPEIEAAFQAAKGGGIAPPAAHAETALQPRPQAAT